MRFNDIMQCFKRIDFHWFSHSFRLLLLLSVGMSPPETLRKDLKAKFRDQLSQIDDEKQKICDEVNKVYSEDDHSKVPEEFRNIVGKD